MCQDHPMFTLVNDNESVIKLGQLRWFLNETCRSLPNSTPIMLNYTIREEAAVSYIKILADEESVELYNF